MTNANSLPSPHELSHARDVLLALTQLPGAWPTDNPTIAELVRLCSRITQRERKELRNAERARDTELRDRVGLRAGKSSADAPATLARFVPCYVCKRAFTQLHHFYDSLCPECAQDHFAKRHAEVDLRGRVALVTGGRVKSGYHSVLKLLRAGAEVIVTTRFPQDAAKRFAREPDADSWYSRLRLVGLELRLLAEVEQFANALVQEIPFLDIFVANAAQTVRRPPAYYRALVEAEREPVSRLPALAQHIIARDNAGSLTRNATKRHAEYSLIPLLPNDMETDAFPQNATTRDGEPLDLRAENSWGLPHAEVATIELIEVHAVNCLAPFLLLRALLPLFRKAPARDRFAVMVSAVEGQFATAKTGRHPHTNMAKAALNMMVRTSAEEFAAERVFLTAVDPGWFSVQAAMPVAERYATHGRIPLDAIDAASRILDPVYTGIATGTPAFGVLFKDYCVVTW